MRNTFAFATHFVNPNQRDDQGLTTFLNACVPLRGAWNFISPFESQNNIKRLGFFLENGSSVQERGLDGSTCLHLFFTGDVSPPSKQDWHDSLKFLIEKGADVYAEDESGQSVSHAAYSRNCSDGAAWSYRGDLWDAVLDACGYDIREFRTGYPRTAGYTPEYTRSDFDSIWNGREKRCPYWNDAVWFSRIGDGGTCGDKSEYLCHYWGACDFERGLSNDLAEEPSKMDIGSGRVESVDNEEDADGEDGQEGKRSREKSWAD